MKEKSSMKEKMRSERHKPLAAQILSDQRVKARAHKQPKQRSRQEEKEYIDPKMSRKILQEAQAQQAEEHRHMAPPKKSRKIAQLYIPEGDDSEYEEEDFSDDDDDYLKEYDMHADDEQVLAKFMSAEPGKRLTLADMVMDRIKEKETEIQSMVSERAAAMMPGMDPKVVAVYRSVGKLLSTYRSGKIPKAFKIIPSLNNWEEILYITEPDNWSAAAMYQASRLFISNLNAKAAQRFFNLVVLPRVRDDIAEFKKLNVHLYQALKKCLFKPQVFFKGILLPLCESGNCTLREAIIIGSVMSKTSVPMLHSAAALLKLAEAEYRGATSIFIRVLLDKKYALPFRVIDALVFHFVRSLNDTREYPVLWHQSFLTFAQRYKEDITTEQKEALLQVLRRHPHPEISDEVRRELVQSKSRDIEGQPMQEDDELLVDLRL